MEPRVLVRPIPQRVPYTPTAFVPILNTVSFPIAPFDRRGVPLLTAAQIAGPNWTPTYGPMATPQYIHLFDRPCSGRVEGAPTQLSVQE